MYNFISKNSNQIECRNNFSIGDSGLKANICPESPAEIVLVESDTCSRSHDTINTSQGVSAEHQCHSFSVTESPETVSLSSQMSEQIPFQDLSTNSMLHHHIEKSPVTETVSQGSSKSPHRYGLVHAWPRSKTSDSSMNRVCLRELLLKLFS